MGIGSRREGWWCASGKLQSSGAPWLDGGMGRLPPGGGGGDLTYSIYIYMFLFLLFFCFVCL